MKKLVVILVLFSLAPGLRAQVGDVSQAWAPEHRKIADRIGTVAVLAQIAVDVAVSLKNDHSLKGIGCAGLPYLVSEGATEILKRVVHEPRPNGLDNLSWPSGHTANAAAGAGWNFYVGVPVTWFVGSSRLWANDHHEKDIWGGLFIGAGAQVTKRLVCH